MGGLISPQQSAFVGGRMIQDNIFVAHEAFHRIKKNHGGLKNVVVLKLNMNKAYDRVEWAFLKSSLVAFGFHEDWVGGIMTFGVLCVVQISSQSLSK